MNLRLDMVHPCKRNEMMLAASIGVGLRELDRIPAFEVIHGSHMHAVGTDDFHIFLDHHWCNHANLLVGIYSLAANCRSERVPRTGDKAIRIAVTVLVTHTV